MNRDLARLVLLRVGNLKGGESILIDDLVKEFPNSNLGELLQIIIAFSSRNYIRIDGKYTFECYNLEKYNKIVGLDKEGYEAVDAIRNDKIWNKVEKCLKDNEYDDFSIFSAITLAKKIIEKEFDNMMWFKIRKALLI